MEIFLSLIACHRFAQRHNSLNNNANEHTLYSLIDTEETSSLIRRTKNILLRNHYSPVTYCSFDVYGQLQTTVQFIFRNVGAFFLIFRNEIKYHREVITTNDGAIIALDWAYLPSEYVLSNAQENHSAYDPYLQDANVPTIILHHGLCGDSYSEHIVFLARRFLKSERTFRVVVVVMRGNDTWNNCTPLSAV